MPTLEDLLPLEEFDTRRAQVLLGDNPTFREVQADIVTMLKTNIRESGEPSMIARLPELDDAYEAYRRDPQWCGGPGHAQLMEARYPLLLFLGVIDD
jgi:hypothetical protein